MAKTDSSHIYKWSCLSILWSVRSNKKKIDINVNRISVRCCTQSYGTLWGRAWKTGWHRQSTMVQNWQKKANKHAGILRYSQIDLEDCTQCFPLDGFQLGTVISNYAKLSQRGICNQRKKIQHSPSQLLSWLVCLSLIRQNWDLEI